MRYGETVDMDENAVADRAETCNGIERSVDDGTAAGVFTEQTRDGLSGGVACSIHFESCR